MAYAFNGQPQYQDIVDIVTEGNTREGDVRTR